MRRRADGSRIRTATGSRSVGQACVPSQELRSTLRLDEDKLKFASRFLSNDDVNQAAAKNIVSGLKAINVRVFEFDSPGQFTSADLDAIRSQSKAPAGARWSKPRMGTKSAEIYMFSKGKDMGGLTIIAAEKRELTVVNIVGPIDLKTLGSLAGKFGIPKDVGAHST